MSEVNCKICESQTKKYKCKFCFIPYCSLQCYKQHKLNPCKPDNGKVIPNLNKSNDSSLPTQKKHVEPLTFEQMYFIRKGISEEDLIPEEKLQRVVGDEKLNLMLQEESVLKVIKDIVDSDSTQFNSEQEKDILINIQRYINSLDKKKRHPLEEILPYLLTILE